MAISASLEWLISPGANTIKSFRFYAYIIAIEIANFTTIWYN